MPESNSCRWVRSKNAIHCALPSPNRVKVLLTRVLNFQWHNLFSPAPLFMTDAIHVDSAKVVLLLMLLLLSTKLLLMLLLSVKILLMLIKLLLLMLPISTLLNCFCCYYCCCYCFCCYRFCCRHYCRCF